MTTDSGTVNLIVIVVASWVNVSLYTVEIGLSIRYFKRPSRPRTHRIAVGLLLISDAICTLAFSFHVLLSTVVVHTTNERLSLAPLTATLITTYISATIAQLFLCNLFYILTGKKVVVAGLLGMIILHVGFSWSSAVLVLVLETSDGIAVTTTVIAAIACAIADVSIAASLALTFWRLMAGTPREHLTNSLLQRTLTLTVSSGVLVAGNTLIVMGLLITQSVAVGFFFGWQGRVYSLTILGNFLIGIPAGGLRGPNISSFGRTTLSGSVYRIAAPPPSPFSQDTSSKEFGEGQRRSSAPALPTISALHSPVYFEDHVLGFLHTKNSASAADMDERLETSS